MIIKHLCISRMYTTHTSADQSFQWFEPGTGKISRCLTRIPKSLEYRTCGSVLPITVWGVREGEGYLGGEVGPGG